ncbi:MAG: hypothetical protein H0T79_13825 [Deltaproteobacteria bacterium]|nr:hypothetical protein [Deltaproteobacteria bacterium]
MLNVRSAARRRLCKLGSAPKTVGAGRAVVEAGGLAHFTPGARAAEGHAAIGHAAEPADRIRDILDLDPGALRAGPAALLAGCTQWIAEAGRCIDLDDRGRVDLDGRRVDLDGRRGIDCRLGSLLLLHALREPVASSNKTNFFIRKSNPFQRMTAE